MNKKWQRLSIGFSIFLFLCAVINFVSGHIGAAVCALGAGIFFVALPSATYEKSKENKQ